MIPADLALDLRPFVPELVVTAGLLCLLVLNLIVRRQRGVVTAIGGVLLLGLAAIATTQGDEAVGAYLFGAVVQDGVTVFFRLFFCAATAICLGLLVFTFRDDGEPFLLVLSGVLGMFLLAGANDLVTLFVALELVSIPSYVLAGYRRTDVKSAEAALKYVVYGAMSSGLLVYGFSFLYGLTGTTEIPEIAARLSAATAQQASLFVALVLVLAGIGYKVAMVPLHFWCPDVYEGSPTAVTAFLSVVPKAAGFVALFRLMPVIIPLRMTSGLSAVTLLTMASVLTMTLGNLAAIWQTSLKRLLAYSSIAHAGYVLMGFAVIASSPQSDVYYLATMSVMLYFVVYMFMNLGAFYIVDLVDRHTGSDSIDYFRGLGQTNPIPAVLLAVFLFSLTGLPPLAGFVGKFFLFAALVKAKLFLLAMFGIANTVVSLYYYVRIIRDMFLHEPLPELAAALPNPGLRLGRLGIALSLVTVVPTIVLGVWWGPLVEWLHLRTW